MAVYSDKHEQRTQVNFYPSLDGGLNLSTPPENLNKNELRDAMNVEFSPLTGSLRVRGGLVWSGKFPENVNRITAVPGYHGFLAKASNSNKLYYFLWNNILNVSGATGIFTLQHGINQAKYCLPQAVNYRFLKGHIYRKSQQ